jgi:UDP-N-acetylglucosamine--N-acetylmuramyl-(pentapeptide) pyrophosphoryl-undecaprenol N-acetylglucosamine transferase
MLNPVLLKEMKEASKKLGIPDAAMRLYNVMKEVIDNKKK